MKKQALSTLSSLPAISHLQATALKPLLSSLPSSSAASATLALPAPLERSFFSRAAPLSAAKGEAALADAAGAGGPAAAAAGSGEGLAAAGASSASAASASSSSLPPPLPTPTLPAQAYEHEPLAWRLAKGVAAATAAAVVGTVGYVTYATDNETLKMKLEDFEQRAQASQGEGPVAALKSRANETLLGIGRKYVDSREELEEWLRKFSAPSSDRLLPDLLPQEQHVFTLVLDLSDTLVHSEWRRDRGWRTFKRPGVEAFLERMAQFFEVVVFTDQLNINVDPILERIDKKGAIRFRLYREATQYTNGNYYKDLSKLNRDPRKVIYISAAPSSTLQKENLLQVSEWKLDNNDTALLDLLPFLECVARQRPPDIRAVLASYEGENIPEAFKERTKEYQRQLQEKRQHGLFRLTRPA